MQDPVVTESDIKNLFVLQKRRAGSLLHVLQSWRDPGTICSFHGEFFYLYLKFFVFRKLELE